MKTGLFFGSFNPIHIGHLIIANSVLEFVDEAWFVISPQNPFKIEKNLADISIRCEMIEVAIKDNSLFKLCEIELSLSIPSYTINTLNILNKTYPQHQFFIIMGSDNYAGLFQWKEPDLIHKYPMFIYERPGFPVDENELPFYHQKLKTPLLNISATDLRERIKNKKSVQYLIPGDVIKIISNKNLYHK